LGVVSKLEALNSTADDGQALFGLVGYDFFGSDGMISQTRIPTALPNVRDNLMGIRIHYKYRKRKHKDMRFIPPPDKKQLDDARPKMKGTLKMAFKYIGDQITPPGKREAFQRLGNILEDYEYARTLSIPSGQSGSFEDWVIKYCFVRWTNCLTKRNSLRV
jgi:hypothetical protein